MLSLNTIQSAYDVLPRCFRDSPLLESSALNLHLGCSISLKVETINPIRSFKGRGCSWLFESRGFKQGDHLICASAGNFGQGVAYVAKHLGIKTTVCVPEAANPLKIRMIESFGAEVQLFGKDFDEAKTKARDHAAVCGAIFIEDGKDLELAEGAATIALEALQKKDDVEVLVCPLGNGSLLSGMAHCAKLLKPSIKVIGVCATAAPAMERSWRAGQVISVPVAATIADGIAVRNPVPEALSLMHGVIDDITLVSETSLMEAMRLLFATTGLVAEPAGVAALAALISDRQRFSNKQVLLPICGGNISATLVTSTLGALS